VLSGRRAPSIGAAAGVRRGLAAVVVVLTATAACGDDPAGDLAAELRDENVLPAGVTLPADREIPDQQRVALEDGVVQRAEYEAAVNGTVACLRAEGVTVSDPEPSSGGRFLEYHYDIVTPPGGDEAAGTARVQALYGNCYVQHEAIVGEAWLRQTTLSEEDRQEALRGLATCLRGTGLDVSDEAPADEIARALPAEPTASQRDCFSLYGDAFVVPYSDGEGGGDR
jgi:hypothetical protein